MTRKMHSMFKKNILFMMATVIIIQLINFLTIPFLGRILSVEMFGVVGFCQAVMIYFTLFTLFGFQTLGTKEVIRLEDKNDVTGNIITLRVIFALVSIAGMMMLIKVMDKNMYTNQILLVYSISLIPLAFNLDWFFAGIYEMKHNGIYNIIKAVVTFAILLVFLKGDKTVLVVPYAVVFGMIVAGAYHVIAYFRLGYKIKKCSKAKGRILFITACPFVMGSILSTINGNVDILMIGSFMSGEALGLYSAAYKIIFFLLSLITVLFNVVFPLLTKYKGKQLERIVNSLIKIAVIISIPIAIGGVIFAEDIMVTLLSGKYMDAANALKILCIYFVFLFFREICAYSLNAWDKEKTYLKIIGFSAVLNCALNFILIKRLGIEGAALSTLICEIVTFIIMRQKIAYKVETTYILEIKKIVLWMVGLAIVLTVFKMFSISVIIVIPVAAAIYGFIAYKFGWINELIEQLKIED